MERLKKYLKYICYLCLVILVGTKTIVDDISWWTAISYTITIVTTFIIIYITILWRYNPLEKYPRLNSKYEGIIKTENYGEKNVEVEIKHNLIYTYIRLKTEESVSKSKAFSIYKDGEEWCLIYTYINEPSILNRGHSDIHYGTCKFDISNKD